MEIKQKQDNVFVCLKNHTQEILKNFHTKDCKFVSTPMNQKEKLSKEDGEEKVDEAYYISFISFLMYLTATRLDILYIMIFYLSSCIEQVIYAIARYIKGTVSYGVKLHRS